MNSIKLIKLKDIAKYSTNRTSSSNYYLSTKNMNKYEQGVYFPCPSIPNQKTYPSYNKGDILISNIRPYFEKIWQAKVNGARSNDILDIKSISPLINQSYLYYALQNSTFFEYVTRTAKGTKMPRGDKNSIMEYKIPLRPLNIQKKIANFISLLENKITLNKQINKNLIKLANFIFLKKFNKSYHGTDTLGKYLNIYDRKRIPLSKRVRSKIRGKYRYIGPTSVLSYINKFNFEGTYVLLGEDGTVHNRQYHPIIQYIWGKFWPNNHTHVLRGKGISNEWLYLFLKNVNVKGIITGAVQQKINQRNLKSIHISIPSKRELDKFQQVITPMFKQLKELTKQNIVLNKLKHELLLKFFN